VTSKFISLQPYDGRVVSNFVIQALKGEDMTVYGDGKQTRSFQYIHDLVDGLIALMNSDETRPVNLGNADEFTVGDFAEVVREIVQKVQKDDGETPKEGKIVELRKWFGITRPSLQRAPLRKPTNKRRDVHPSCKVESFLVFSWVHCTDIVKICKFYL
jgi:nucleoside-diphosphate-sugar epimerase